MAKYAAEMNRTASATLSVGTLVADAGTPRRIALYDLIVGSEANPPQDFAFLYQVQRCTTAGTGTALTPAALDSADPAALFDALENLTVDPTLTAGAILLAEAVNQRSTFRWVAAPGGELIAPATAANGFAIRTPTAGAAVAITALAHVEER